MDKADKIKAMMEEEARKQEKENAELKDQMVKKDQRIEELEAQYGELAPIWLRLLQSAK